MYSTSRDVVVFIFLPCLLIACWEHNSKRPRSTHTTALFFHFEFRRPRSSRHQTFSAPLGVRMSASVTVGGSLGSSTDCKSFTNITSVLTTMKWIFICIVSFPMASICKCWGCGTPEPCGISTSSWQASIWAPRVALTTAFAVMCGVWVVCVTVAVGPLAARSMSLVKGRRENVELCVGCFTFDLVQELYAVGSLYEVWALVDLAFSAAQRVTFSLMLLMSPMNGLTPHRVPYVELRRNSVIAERVRCG